MRSFQNVIVFLFALVMCVFAAEEMSYDTTVYVTSTLYRTNTVRLSSSPTGSVENQTSTIHATGYAVPSVTSSYSTNNTASVPTGSATMPSASEFTGAASSLNVNALVVALAAGVGYLVL